MTLIRRMLMAAPCLLLGGCYYLQAMQGQLSVMARREPISKLVERPDTDAALRARLVYAQAAREFATRELGLPDNDSYTSFVQLRHNFVTWNVFAAAEFSVTPQQWCFPIAGCVVYRGYFSEGAAEREALRLRSRGFDAAVSGVPAYSTLGHFADPVLSSMLRWGDAQLAATLFHELAHQVVYVQDDSAFNEAFATTVEQEGLRRWLTLRGQSAQLTAWQAQQQRANEFSMLLLQARDDLRALYASQPALPKAALWQRKQQRLGLLKFQYQQLKVRWQGYAGYNAWFGRTLSNADFIAIATYQQCVPVFERLLAEVNGDLPRFYAEVKKMARQDQPTRQRVCQGEAG